MKNEKVNVITLGCSKNTVDSERLMKQLLLNNVHLTETPDEAETVIINTCGFIEEAKKESVDTILNAVALKNEGKLKKVIVAGCLSERYKEDLIKEIPEVDVFFGTENYEGIVKEFGGELKYELLGERVLTTPSHSAYLKISEGCDNPCSFCAIPLMRGKHKSKTIEELIRETEFLAANNTKEIIIIAQDTTDYGKDIYNKQMLATLINNLSEVKGIEWIRLMYAYPSRFPDDLFETIRENPKVCNYIDIPLQHISDNVLKSMRRGISSRRTKELIFNIKTLIPGVALRTTFITGYPNEKQEDFEELCNFVKEVEFDRLGVFKFSVEENTPSFILGDPVSEEEKEERKSLIMEIQKEISLRKNETFVNQKMKVLLEAKEGNFYVGRTFRDAPEVDGEVLISSEKKLKSGTFVNAQITDCNEYDLFATV